MANNADGSEILSRARTIRLVWYNLGLVLVMSLLMYRVIMQASEADAAAQATAKQTAKTELAPAKKPSPQPATQSLDSSATTFATDDSSAAPAVADETDAETVSPEEEGQPAQQENLPSDPRMIAYVLWAISLAGGLGGVLSNLRGVFEFERDQSYFPAYLELPFYLRPVSGVLCGLFSFFVSSFFAGALTEGDSEGWKTLAGMFPYIGIAFIAGYASQEFMERLKETAKTLFGVPSSAEPPAAPPPPEPPVPPAPDDADEGHESFRAPVADDAGLESMKKGAQQPPVSSPPPPPSPPSPPTYRRRAD